MMKHGYIGEFEEIDDHRGGNEDDLDVRTHLDTLSSIRTDHFSTDSRVRTRAARIRLVACRPPHCRTWPSQASAKCTSRSVAKYVDAAAQPRVLDLEPLDLHRQQADARVAPQLIAEAEKRWAAVTAQRAAASEDLADDVHCCARRRRRAQLAGGQRGERRDARLVAARRRHNGQMMMPGVSPPTT